jgi:hypothetical protein
MGPRERSVAVTRTYRTPESACPHLIARCARITSYRDCGLISTALPSWTWPGAASAIGGLRRRCDRWLESPPAPVYFTWHRQSRVILEAPSERTPLAARG